MADVEDPGRQIDFRTKSEQMEDTVQFTRGLSRKISDEVFDSYQPIDETKDIDSMTNTNSESQDGAPPELILNNLPSSQRHKLKNSLELNDIELSHNHNSSLVLHPDAPEDNFSYVPESQLDFNDIQMVETPQSLVTPDIIDEDKEEDEERNGTLNSTKSVTFDIGPDESPSRTEQHNRTNTVDEVFAEVVSEEEHEELVQRNMSTAHYLRESQVEALAVSPYNESEDDLTFDPTGTPHDMVSFEPTKNRPLSSLSPSGHRSRNSFDADIIDQWSIGGDELQLTGNTVTKTKTGGWHTVYGAGIISGGKVKWLLQINHVASAETDMYLGVSMDTNDSRINANFCYHNSGYGVDASGFKANSRSNLREYMSGEWRDGDIVTVILDLNEGTLSYSINSDVPNVAFSDLPQGKYRLAVSMWSMSDSVTLADCLLSDGTRFDAIFLPQQGDEKDDETTSLKQKIAEQEKTIMKARTRGRAMSDMKYQLSHLRAQNQMYEQQIEDFKKREQDYIDHVTALEVELEELRKSAVTTPDGITSGQKENHLWSSTPGGPQYGEFLPDEEDDTPGAATVTPGGPDDDDDDGVPLDVKIESVQSRNMQLSSQNDFLRAEIETLKVQLHESKHDEEQHATDKERIVDLEKEKTDLQEALQVAVASKINLVAESSNQMNEMRRIVQNLGLSSRREMRKSEGLQAYLPRFLTGS